MIRAFTFEHRDEQIRSLERRRSFKPQKAKALEVHIPWRLLADRRACQTLGYGSGLRSDPASLGRRTTFGWITSVSFERCAPQLR